MDGGQHFHLFHSEAATISAPQKSRNFKSVSAENEISF